MLIQYNTLVRDTVARSMLRSSDEFLKLADRIIPNQFDGDVMCLASFLDALALLDSFAAGHTPLAVAFVKTRLVGVARDVIVGEVSVTQIISTLKKEIVTPSSFEVEQRMSCLSLPHVCSGDFIEDITKLSGLLKHC